MVQSTLFLTALLSSSALAAVSFKPTVGDSWNIQLKTPPKPSQANDASYSIWDMDMADTDEDTIQAFKDKGHKVICYFSAGSWEKWRSDKDQLPAVAIGKTMSGWPDEKWLDTRNAGVRDVMKARIQQAASKGCDGVDPDNIDGYENDTGFSLTKADGVDYVNFLSATAHAAGLSYGLKNGGAIVPQVVGAAEWVINEQCVQYSECALYQPFIKQGKPVLHIEYTKKDPAPQKFVQKSCDNAGAKGFSTLIKHLSLNAWTETCHDRVTNAARRRGR